MINPRMLTIARESRGLTQAELVERVPNLSQGNYSRMEKGLLPIPNEISVKIAQELSFPVDFFELNAPVTIQTEYFYRKRVTMPRKHQIKLEAEFDLLKIWIDGLLSDVEIPDFSIPAIEVKNDNTPALVARKVRALLRIGKGPIENLIHVLERNGLLIYFLKDAPEKFDGTVLITNTGQRIIVINADLPNDRKIYTIAHELGHVVLHLQFSPIIDSDRDVDREADIFASEFLMPEAEVMRDLLNIRQSTLGDLKRYWKVSKAALIRRAYDLMLINKNKYTNLMIELSRSGERRTEREDIGLNSPRLLPLIIKTYLETLNYERKELLDIVKISEEDFNNYIMEIEPKRAKFKIII